MKGKSRFYLTIKTKKSDTSTAPNEADMTHSPPKSFIILLIVVAVGSFLLGAVLRIWFISHGIQTILEKKTYGRTTPLTINSQTVGNVNVNLPAPKLFGGKKVPTSTYSSKIFPLVSVATATCDTAQLDQETHVSCMKPMTMKNLGNTTDVYSYGDPPRDHWKPMARKGSNLTLGSQLFVDEAVHHPSGQHLLVDIKNVDANFLNSEGRLAEAMVQLIKEARLTLLSYRCHSLVPVGVSCIGVLVESHIALHTWPLEGVISLDLYTCGSGRLIPVLPSIERLFGVRQVADGIPTAGTEEPAMLWSHKLRGFRERSWENVEHDFGEDIASKRILEMKKHLVSKETDYQQVDVIAVLDPRTYTSLSTYKKSLSEDGSYESLHPEFYDPDRLVFLDGQIQSSLKGERAYHEALVHPAMITHPNPKRVAIIGGGEGATLRETLKHKTVEKALMLEIDGEEVEILRQHIPEWSDCSDFSEGPGSCYDDPRTELLTVDAVKWFVDNFGENKSDERFDVIIMDALDPNDQIDFAAGLYNSSTFERSLVNALTDDGILVAQLGRSPAHRDPADEVGAFAARAGMISMLEQLGLESLHVYDEAHSEFDAPWSYLVALKDYRLRSNWHRTAPELDVQIRRRILRTKSGELALKRFDAPTMVEYQVPPKTFQVNYCRQHAHHPECKDLYDVCKTSYVTHKALQVHQSSLGQGAGRGLFAMDEIPTDSCLLINDAPKSFHILPSTWSVMDGLSKKFLDASSSMAKKYRGLYAFATFITGYGYVSHLLGRQHYSVESNIAFFMNHGCNQTYNYGEEYSPITELNADPKRIPPEYDTSAEVYSPMIERHLRAYLSGPESTLRDIKKGEEILANYLPFVAYEEGWEEDVLRIRGQCSGDLLGEISEYEKEMG